MSDEIRTPKLITAEEMAGLQAKVTRRAANLKSRYNLSPEDYDLFAEMQEFCCAICEREQDPLCVDHDHKAEEKGVMAVRGLLCTRCNVGIGMFKDDAEILRKAAEYIDPKIRG